MRAPVKVCVLASTGFGLLIQSANAETLVHLKRTVWGCFDPNVTPVINDDTNPNHENPQWVTQTSVEGQCVMITPESLWTPLSTNYNGLTYVTHRGTIGEPGSFWVPTVAIAFSSATQAASAITRAALPLPKVKSLSTETSAEPKAAAGEEPIVPTIASSSAGCDQPATGSLKRTDK